MNYYIIDGLPIQSEIELNEGNGYPLAPDNKISEARYNELLNPTPVEPTEFEIAKASKQQELNVWAYTFVTNGYTDIESGYALFTSEEDVNNYLKVAASVQFLPDNFEVEFGTMSGWVKETAINVKAILSRYTQYVYPITAKLMRVKGEIERATTVEQIEAIVI